MDCTAYNKHTCYNASVEIRIGTSYKHGARLADTWHCRQQQEQLQAGGSEESAHTAPFPPHLSAEKQEAEEEAGGEEGQGDDSCPKQRAASEVPPGSGTEGSHGGMRWRVSGGHDDTAGTHQGLRTLNDPNILEAGDVMLALQDITFDDVIKDDITSDDISHSGTNSPRLSGHLLPQHLHLQGRVGGPGLLQVERGRERCCLILVQIFRFKKIRCQ